MQPKQVVAVIIYPNSLKIKLFELEIYKNLIKNHLDEGHSSYYQNFNIFFIFSNLNNK